MAPVVHSLESEFSSRVNFVYLDIDDPANRVFMQQLHFLQTPHFYLLDPQGHILKQWVGYATYDQMRQALLNASP
jgi:hypothetical protein